jgi:hypothetical protein
MDTTLTAPGKVHTCTYAAERAVNSRSRRQILATVLMLASLTGHSDGATWATCVGCGERACVGGTPRAMDTFNLGHVHSDADGGMWCVCNFLPLCRQCNVDMGKAHMMDVLIPIYDNRDMWDGKLMRDPGNNESAPEANRGMSRWNRPTAL